MISGWDKNFNNRLSAERSWKGAHAGRHGDKRLGNKFCRVGGGEQNFSRGATHSQSSTNLRRQSRNSWLPPWWKCRAGREADDSFSLKTMKVQPSSFTVTDLSSLTAKVSVHLLLSWLWLTETAAARTGAD